eukprot:2299732-Rhodomonas_salina.4
MLPASTCQPALRPSCFACLVAARHMSAPDTLGPESPCRAAGYHLARFLQSATDPACARGDDDGDGDGDPDLASPPRRLLSKPCAVSMPDTI